MKKTIDARGLACPLPVVNAKKAAEEMTAGGELTVLVDNEIAVQNLQKFAKQKGFAATGEKLGERHYSVTLTVGEVQNQAPVEVACSPDIRSKGMVVVLSGNTMGVGDEKLGKQLMKAFIFALTKQDVLPEIILCYNSGAFLTCSDSEVLEDFKAMEAEGVQIFTCGTCLDFYGIKDKLAVGGVTNMYDIVETMELASKVVKP